MKVGVSSACFYPEITDIAISNILQNGVDTGGVHLMELFLNTYSETKKEYGKSIKKKVDEKNIFVSSIHPFTSKYEQHLFFSDYPPRFNDGLTQYQMYYDFANEVGAKIVVLHGCVKHTVIENHDYFERFAKMREHAKRSGIILAQENVAMYKSHDPNFIAQMKEYLHGEVEFVFDIKQSVRAGVSPWDMLEAMGENIVHTHLSDHKFIKDRLGKEICLDCLPIGKGSFDFHRFFMQLQKLNYQGNGVIELYHHNYKDYSELYKSSCKLNDILSHL